MAADSIQEFLKRPEVIAELAKVREVVQNEAKVINAEITEIAQALHNKIQQSSVTELPPG